MLVPTGTVSVIDTTSSNVLASGTLDASGNASLTWTAVAGTYNLQAKYSGDAAFDPGVSAVVTYVVNAAMQNVNVNLSVSPASPQQAGTTVTFGVGVTPA